MADEGKYVIRCDVNIQPKNWQSGGLSIREEVTTKNLTFREMAEIMEAFHKLIEQYKGA